MNDIALAVESRRDMCLRCDHRHDFAIADDDVFLCKLRYRSTCSMKVALRDKHMTCPHENAEWRILWSMAGLDAGGGCGTLDTTPPLTPQQLADLRKQAHEMPTVHERRGISKQTKVYQ